ncbi:MAG: DUF1015 domain-containing protein [Acidobacteria bacterium]|nr:DUF1015 domain-containing protein [Acidobacteriota bacterium]
MAIVVPFAAYRYDAKKVGGLERVLTQPYDKITPEMQRNYLQRSPFNLAHIIKGEVREGDSATDNVYLRASAYFRSWREQGVLAQRRTPAFYAYFQQFSSPAPYAPSTFVRKSFIGLGQLEEYDRGTIFRHEQTLSAPKADRLELLRATRTHFEQIFMLYSDPERYIERLLDRVAAQPPRVRVEDEYGVVHRLWDVEEPLQIQALQERMRDRKLIIADGHHRYETALQFHRECQARHRHSGSSDCSFVPMSFVNIDSEGLVILPTHRLVSGLEKLTAEAFMACAARFFQIREYPYSEAGGWETARGKLQSDMASLGGVGAAAIGAIFQERRAFYLLQLREALPLEELLAGFSPAERSLDVTVLHRIAFGLCLGMDEESVREEKYLTYVREFQEGVETVLQGKAQACFFLNPVKVKQVWEIALQGRLLPQKTTDFYPKLLSGLAIHQLES